MREALPDPALGPCLRLLIPTPAMPRIRSQARNEERTSFPELAKQTTQPRQGDRELRSDDTVVTGGGGGDAPR